MAKDTIGIDVSKAGPDAFWHSRDEARGLPNSPEGFAQLCDWVGQREGVLIVFEATGAYHRGLERYLGQAGLSFIKVNPRQARRLPRRSAVWPKPMASMPGCWRAWVLFSTWRLKARSQRIHDLRELLTARRALIKDQVTAKTRLATAINPLIREQLRRRVDDIAADIQALDEVIAQIAKMRGRLEDRIRRLMTIPGIGRLTATTMLVDMPEFGHLDSKKAAALAGLAPMTQRTGKWQGKERILGGRTSSRRAIYMPALVAIRFNSDLKAACQRLLKAGKVRKVAITAVMRRMVVLANTLLREGRDWQPERP